MTISSIINVQNISILLTLLGTNTVEERIGSMSSSYYDRMTGVWSVFGLFGAFRYYLKIAVGLANSEKVSAGLGDAAIHTRHRTKSSSCYLAVNRENTPPSWRSSKDELLSLMRSTTSSVDTHASESTWLRPIFIAIGHSRCPFDLRNKHGADEFGFLLSYVLFSLITALLFPAADLLSALYSFFSALLFPGENPVSLSQNFGRAEVNNAFLQAAVCILLGIFLPIIIDGLNAPATVHLSQLDKDPRLSKSDFLLQDGDLVMADSNRKEAHIVWQTAPDTEYSERRASGDIWWIRVLSALSCLLILGATVSTYNILANASGSRQRVWMTAQLYILIARNKFWHGKPRPLNPHRPYCIVYIATGSLVEPLPVTPPPKRIQASHPTKLAPTAINFAVAAAISKAHDDGSEPVLYRSELYTKLANTAPADIISAEYVQLGEHFHAHSESKPMSVLRLSWDVVEEMYRAQGVVLGPDPWVFGGIYLGAVFVKETFVGLTTVHPFQLHLRHCTYETCISRHHEYQDGGFTRDGYFISDLVYGTAVRFVYYPTSSLAEQHDMFRSNVTRCRETSRSNGPSHTEIHAAASGLKPSSKQLHVSRIEPAPKLVDIIQASAYHSKTKDHHGCNPELCEVYSF